MVVEFEVPGVHDTADRGVDDQSGVIRDRVGHAEEIHGEVAADLDAGVGRHLAQVNVALAEFELLELAAQQTQGQLCSVHRDAREQLQHVGQTTDVVFVTVGQYPALDAFSVLHHPVDLGYQDVDAEHVSVRECESAVDEEYLVLVLEGEHVLADLAHPAQRDDAQFPVVLFCHDSPVAFQLRSCRRSRLKVAVIRGRLTDIKGCLPAKMTGGHQSGSAVAVAARSPVATAVAVTAAAAWSPVTPVPVATWATRATVATTAAARREHPFKLRPDKDDLAAVIDTVDLDVKHVAFLEVVLAVLDQLGCYLAVVHKPIGV